MNTGKRCWFGDEAWCRDDQDSFSMVSSLYAPDQNVSIKESWLLLENGKKILCLSNYFASIAAIKLWIHLFQILLLFLWARKHKHDDSTHPLPLPSNEDSNQILLCCHWCGSRFPLCSFWSLWSAAGSTRNGMDPMKRSRSCCPSRSSRPHRWFSQSR